MTPGIQAVIFDFGGVLVADDGRAHAAIARQVGLPAPDVDRVLSGPAVVEGWNRVRVGALPLEAWFADVRRLCLAAFGERGEAVFRCWADLPPIPNRPVLELVERLHGRYRLAVLSNADPRLEAYLEEHLGIARRFDVVVNSCREGCAKPEARIYRVTLERLGVPAASAVFVDDVEANVEGARAVGMAGVRFTDYEGLVRDLRDLGVAC